MSTHLTHSEEETEAVAFHLAAGLEAGDVLLISGDLGAGKTAFVRGLAAGLGIEPAEVSSPTFTLVHEYRGGRLRLYHADLYRLTPTGAEELGLEEQRVAGGVLAVEWPDRLTHPVRSARLQPGQTRPRDAITVEMEIAGETTRRITVQPIPSGSSGPLS